MSDDDQADNQSMPSSPSTFFMDSDAEVYDPDVVGALPSELGAAQAVQFSMPDSMVGRCFVIVAGAKIEQLLLIQEAIENCLTAEGSLSQITFQNEMPVKDGLQVEILPLGLTQHGVNRTVVRPSVAEAIQQELAILGLDDLAPEAVVISTVSSALEIFVQVRNLTLEVAQKDDFLLFKKCLLRVVHANTILTPEHVCIFQHAEVANHLHLGLTITVDHTEFSCDKLLDELGPKAPHRLGKALVLKNLVEETQVRLETTKPFWWDGIVNTMKPTPQRLNTISSMDKESLIEQLAKHEHNFAELQATNQQHQIAAERMRQNAIARKIVYRFEANYQAIRSIAMQVFHSWHQEAVAAIRLRKSNTKTLSLIVLRLQLSGQHGDTPAEHSLRSYFAWWRLFAKNETLGADLNRWAAGKMLMLWQLHSGTEFSLKLRALMQWKTWAADQAELARKGQIFKRMYLDSLVQQKRERFHWWRRYTFISADKQYQLARSAERLLLPAIRRQQRALSQAVVAWRAWLAEQHHLERTREERRNQATRLAAKLFGDVNKRKLFGALSTWRVWAQVQTGLLLTKSYAVRTIESSLVRMDQHTLRLAFERWRFGIASVTAQQGKQVRSHQILRLLFESRDKAATRVALASWQRRSKQLQTLEERIGHWQNRSDTQPLHDAFSVWRGWTRQQTIGGARRDKLLHAMAFVVRKRDEWAVWHVWDLWWSLATQGTGLARIQHVVFGRVLDSVLRWRARDALQWWRRITKEETAWDIAKGKRALQNPHHVPLDARIQASKANILVHLEAMELQYQAKMRRRLRNAC